ncbi:MAG: hypothetical protein AB7U73_10335 [Pirellulales bacterium]
MRRNLSAGWLARRILVLGMISAIAGTVAAPALAQRIVPGTGSIVVGDDFEDESWSYTFNNPKGSKDIDGNRRKPSGYSSNGHWYEGPDRGHPDVIRRVPTPPDGLPGSTGALLMASRYTGIPNKGRGPRAQDDLFMHATARSNGVLPVSLGPSVVVRVWLPPWEDWEPRSGSTFGFRTTVRGLTSDGKESEPYWPGIFINYSPGNERRNRPARTTLAVRARESGQDYTVMNVEEVGWWTMGMSYSPDGRVHYYAHPGLDDLTESDHLASHYPYNFRCKQLKSVFFDIFNQNDGNWSTGWIIDDPTVYVVREPQVARQPQRSSGSRNSRRSR